VVVVVRRGAEVLGGGIVVAKVIGVRREIEVERDGVESEEREYDFEVSTTFVHFFQVCPFTHLT